MKYVTADIRRQDRVMDEARAREVLATCEYGYLSMIADNGEPYGIPINYVWDGQDSLYIHCAHEGRKIRAIQMNPCVSFCVVGKVHLLPQQFSTERESVVLKGIASIGMNDEEKRKALMLSLEKLAPENMSNGLKYISNALQRVEVIKIVLSEFSGKCKVI